MTDFQDESKAPTIREKAEQKRRLGAEKSTDESDDELSKKTNDIDEFELGDDYSDNYESEEDEEDESYDDDKYDEESSDELEDELVDLSDESLDALDDDPDFYGDNEDYPRRKTKKRKVKKIGGAKKMTRKKIEALLEGPCKVCWGVFSPEMKKLFDFPFDQEDAARQKAEELTQSKGAEHFVQRLKIPIKPAKKK